ncbi:MAG: isoamylase early set domain-containing protein [Candidatus Eisenbacteria bacterium]
MVRVYPSGRVLFRYSASARGPVYLVGDFNNWSEQSHPMRRRKDGGWELALPLEPGKYCYKFLCREGWYNDPEAEDYEPNEWGSCHSAVRVDLPRASRGEEPS